jgi:hypothetical protein
MVFVIIYLILSVVFAIIGSEMAKSRNRDAAAWALICALTGLLGIIVLAVAGPAESQAAHPVALPSPTAQPSKSSAFSVLPSYDEYKWQALIEIDDDIANSVKLIEPYGQKYLHDFATKYLAIGDKEYLLVLTEKIITNARQDAEKAVARLSEERDLSLEEAERNYLEYVAKLKSNNGSDPTYNVKVVKIERYLGKAKAFENGLKVEMADGSFALKCGAMTRLFKDDKSLAEWG